MTLSAKDRADAVGTALRRMAEDLDGQWIAIVRFIVESERFADLPRTTWSELKTQMWVTPKHNLGEEAYCLTGPGLIAAMKATGELEAQEHKERCIQLRKALQALVKGREVPYGGTDIFSLVASTGLSDGWIFNAIDARFLTHMWPGEHVEIEWRNREVRVSREFGHRRLFGLEAGPLRIISGASDEIKK